MLGVIIGNLDLINPLLADSEEGSQLLQEATNAALRRRPKTTESGEVTRPEILAREIPARASPF